MDYDIQTTVDLWESLSKVADFKSNEYDKALLHSIIRRLHFEEDKSIIFQIKSNQTGIEELLAAFIRALEPFSRMMSDLLEMFQNASAFKTDNNLLIEFDFEKSKNKFNLNLEAFKDITHKSKAVLNYYKYRLKSDRSLFKVIDLMNSCITSNYYIVDNSNDVKRWIKEYENDKWPTFIPEKPIVGMKEIDEKLSILWQFMVDHIEIYKSEYNFMRGRKGSLNDYLENHVYNPSNNKNESDVTCSFDRNQSIDGFNSKQEEYLWIAETDCWTRSLMKTIDLVARHTDWYAERKDYESLSLIIRKLDNCLKMFESKKGKNPIQKRIDEVIELLNMPFWKKRYEVYSAWVCTQIVKALDDHRIEYNVIDDKLSFSFAGSHIATCTDLNPPLHIWTELRTAYKSRIKEGKRKKHIQPDYSLAVDNVKDPKNTAVVVECKQYKRYSSRNFSHAVVDYANGRPNATVLLASYTDVPGQIYDRVYDLDDSIDIYQRIPFIKRLAPGSTCEFMNEIRKAVEDYYKN